MLVYPAVRHTPNLTLPCPAATGPGLSTPTPSIAAVHGTPQLQAFHSMHSLHSMASEPVGLHSGSQDGTTSETKLPALPRQQHGQQQPGSRSVSPSRLALPGRPYLGAVSIDSSSVQHGQMLSLPAAAVGGRAALLGAAGATALGPPLPAANLGQAVGQLLDCFKALMQVGGVA